MTKEEKKKIGQRLTTRVSTGLYFIQENYLNDNPTPDLAWIRNIYILLSFYTELLLKGIYVIKGSFIDTSDFDKKIRRQGHNLEKIGKAIDKTELLALGIKSIKSVKHEYFIETEKGDFYVNDFNDIRYDFLDSRVRTITGDEHDEFKKQIEIMHGIVDQLKPLVWD